LTEAHKNAVLDAIIERTPLIESALEYGGGTHTVYDIARGVLEGQFQLWVAPNSVAVTEIVQHPQQKECTVFLCAGVIAEIEAVRPAIEDWAKKHGCARIVLTGRKGWERVLGASGYKPQWFVLAKELHNEP
jgi:hypothetical protein